MYRPTRAHFSAFKVSSLEQHVDAVKRAERLTSVFQLISQILLTVAYTALQKTTKPEGRTALLARTELLCKIIYSSLHSAGIPEATLARARTESEGFTQTCGTMAELWEQIEHRPWAEDNRQNFISLYWLACVSDGLCRR
jgi:hypothetical protein